MIFVDSSAWLALADVRDGNHKSALSFHRELLHGKSGRLLTSDYALDETLTLMRKRSGGEATREFVGNLTDSLSLQQIWVTPAHYSAALEMFLGQGTRSWSFTDCTSFAIMRELGVREAFTFDGDFRQAGFQPRPT
ncbi:MAG: type II toxin-antitoxin system VapC family toxin [Thermoplasmata archaeon]